MTPRPYAHAIFAPDVGDKAGALLLKQRIEDYWRALGCEVCVPLRHSGFLWDRDTPRYDLRSDMVNGWPPATKPYAARR